MNDTATYNSLIKKNVVITGGATGIGSVIAKYFYEVPPNIPGSATRHTLTL